MRRGRAAPQRHEDDDGPGEQHRRQVVGAVALAGPEPVRDERDRDGREDPAGGDLEQDVGQRVDALVDLAHAPGAHGVGEHEDAGEPGGAGEQRRERDEPGGSRDPGASRRPVIVRGDPRRRARAGRGSTR